MNLWYDFKTQSAGVGVGMDQGRSLWREASRTQSQKNGQGDVGSRHDAVVAKANRLSLTYCGYKQ
jgi:hypothetical protein